MKFNVQLGLIVEAKNADEAHDLLLSMKLEHEIPDDYPAGVDEFIDYFTIHSIEEEDVNAPTGTNKSNV